MFPFAEGDGIPLGSLTYTAQGNCIKLISYGNRTRVFAMKKRRPRPLDERNVGTEKHLSRNIPVIECAFLSLS